VAEFLKSKQPGQVDSDEVQQIKGLIRRGEAKSALRYAGLDPDTRAHFLDLPFYETGRVRKKPLGDEDIRIMMELLNRILVSLDCGPAVSNETIRKVLKKANSNPG